MTLRSEHVEDVFFNQNTTLQISFFNTWRLCSILRSEHHPSNLTLVFPLFDQNITKPQKIVFNSLLHCYGTVLYLAATTLQIVADLVHACIFLKPYICTKLAYKNVIKKQWNSIPKRFESHLFSPQNHIKPIYK